MTITALPPVMDLEQWDAFTDAHPEERWELIRGVPVMSPPEIVTNHEIAFNLCVLLRGALGTEWKALPGVDPMHPHHRPDLHRTPPGRPPGAVRAPTLSTPPEDAGNQRRSCSTSLASTCCMVKVTISVDAEALRRGRTRALQHANR